MGALTTYGQQSLLAIGGSLQDAPQLYLALFSNSANPSGTPTELILTNYVRQPVPFYAVTADQLANAADIPFRSLSAGSFLGAQLVDAITGGGCWSWVDQASSFTIPASSDLTFPAGTLTVTR